MTQSQYSRVILDHYGKEAREYGTDASSTMRDEITRGTEIASIRQSLKWLAEANAPHGSVLDIGCGNGYLLELLRRDVKGRLAGLDYTPDMIALARERKIADVELFQGDVRKMDFADASWDVVITERCIINVMDTEDQARSLREVGRIIKPGGHFICIEAFQDGLDNLNAARTELGLPPNVVPHHNLWFGKSWFYEVIADQFEVVNADAENPSLPPIDFLSSHYFMSRAVYPVSTKGNVTYNTHFAKFFAAQFSRLPPVGSYSPIQFHLLRRK